MRSERWGFAGEGKMSRLLGEKHVAQVPLHPWQELKFFLCEMKWCTWSVVLCMMRCYHVVILQRRK